MRDRNDNKMAEDPAQITIETDVINFHNNRTKTVERIDQEIDRQQSIIEAATGRIEQLRSMRGGVASNYDHLAVAASPALPDDEPQMPSRGAYQGNALAPHRQQSSRRR